MKILNLLFWVTQFGFNVLFPLCLFLYVGFWLQSQFDLGIWIMALSGAIGFLTSISTAKNCMRSLLKARDESSPPKNHPVSFNDHT